MALTAITPAMITLLAIVAIWELAWKGLGMWKSARHERIAWFVCILIFNTLGILPIIYLAFFEKKSPKKRPAR